MKNFPHWLHFLFLFGQTSSLLAFSEFSSVTLTKTGLFNLAELAAFVVDDNSLLLDPLPHLTCYNLHGSTPIQILELWLPGILFSARWTLVVMERYCYYTRFSNKS